MRFVLASLVALAGCTSATTAKPAPQTQQALWTAQSSTTNNHLRGVWGTSAGDVYAVGANATILHTGNHGAAWTAQQTDGLPLLFSIGGTGPRDLHAVGTGGVAYHSEDGGATWTLKKTGSYLPLHSVWAAPAGKVFVAAGDDLSGSQVLSTTGSADWAVTTAIGEVATPRPDAPEPAELLAIWGVGDDLFAVGEDEMSGGGSLVMHSADGGKSWTKRTNEVPEHLMSVWGSSAGDVYAVGHNGMIVRSTDRAASWTRLASGTDNTLYAVWGSGPGDVYAVGDQGTILHSADQGKSWQPQASGSKKWLSGIWGSGPNDIYVVGEDGTVLHHG